MIPLSSVGNTITDFNRMAWLWGTGMTAWDYSMLNSTDFEQSIPNELSDKYPNIIHLLKIWIWG